VCRQPCYGLAYVVLCTAPAFHDDGSLLPSGHVTVLHDGVVIHNHFQLLRATSYIEPPRYRQHAEKEPLVLQFHGNPVRFRNIWIRENVTPLVGLSPDPRKGVTEPR